MSGIKSLVKDTAVYGLSSIVGRFLNWCLVPLYVYLYPPQEYGIVSNLYSYTAVILVILNYGMETGFFRFANSEDQDPDTVYSTSLISIATTSLLFIALLSVFLTPVAEAMLLPQYKLFIWLLGVIVAIDAFSNIPFAFLRYKNKAFRFAGIKILNVGLNIGLNLFFLLACPAIMKSAPALISWFYTPLGGEEFRIGWIFVANLISSVVVLIALLPQLRIKRYVCDFSVLKRMLSYSWPLLILGVAGILSQNMGQLIMPYLFKGEEAAAQRMVGIYGANIKIAIVMVMFTQAFRYAYEPFIFSQAKSKGEDKKQAYCDAMKYFVIFGLLIFLGVMFFLPIIKHFESPEYWEGLSVVPVMMVAELCFGVFFNLSLWYKLTDRTQWGMYFSLLCFFIMFGLNVFIVRTIGIPDGYIGCAYAALISYFIVMVLSYFAGRHYYPIPYQTGRIILYVIFAGLLYFAGSLAESIPAVWMTYLIKIILLAVYVAAVGYYENEPFISSFFRRK